MSDRRAYSTPAQGSRNDARQRQLSVEAHLRRAAMAQIGSGGHIAMGMAAAEPPALLKALADRIEAGSLDDPRLWYSHSLPHAATTLLRSELLGRMRPHCMFLSPVERMLIERRGGGQEGGTISRIVPRLDGPVTTPRNDTHVVVTEYGRPT